MGTLKPELYRNSIYNHGQCEGKCLSPRPKEVSNISRLVGQRTQVAWEEDARYMGVLACGLGMSVI